VTVAELIAHLEEMPGDREVIYSMGGGCEFCGSEAFELVTEVRTTEDVVNGRGLAVEIW
jgi:hypothetical protein